MLFRIITFTNKEGARDQKGRIKYESRRREGKREKRREGNEEKINEKRIMEVKQTWSR